MLAETRSAETACLDQTTVIHPVRYFTITVVSPCGTRDFYTVRAIGRETARIAVAALIAKDRPNWRAI